MRIDLYYLNKKRSHFNFVPFGVKQESSDHAQDRCATKAFCRTDSSWSKPARRPTYYDYYDYYYYHYYHYYYYIDRRIYLNLYKSTQSAAGPKALQPAANGRYFMCKSLPYYFHVLYRSTCILLSSKCMLGLFVFP